MAVWQYYVITRSNLVSVILSSILSCNTEKTCTHLQRFPMVDAWECGDKTVSMQTAMSCFDWYINYNRNQTTKLHDRAQNMQS